MFASETMPHPLTQIEIVNRLRKVGFTQEQAETQTQIITEVNENTLATKQDIQKQIPSLLSLGRRWAANLFYSTKKWNFSNQTS